MLSVRIRVNNIVQLTNNGRACWWRGVVQYLVKTSRSSPCVWCCGYRRQTPSVSLRAAGFRGPGTWTFPCRAGSAVRVSPTFYCVWSLDRSVTSASTWCTCLHANNMYYTAWVVIIFIIQSQLGLPSLRVGKWVPASAGKAKAGMVHSVSGWMRGVQVKLWDPLRTRAIPERLRGVTTRRYTNPRLTYVTLPYMSRHAQQKSQVISRSENPRARSPGCTFFLKKIDDIFFVVALKTPRLPTPLRLFHCQNKTNKVVSGQIW